MMQLVKKKRKALADTVTRVCLYENACQHRIPKKKKKRNDLLMAFFAKRTKQRQNPLFC